MRHGTFIAITVNHMSFQDLISLGPMHRTNMAFQFIQVLDDPDAKLVSPQVGPGGVLKNLYECEGAHRPLLTDAFRSLTMERSESDISDAELTIFPPLQVSLNTNFWLSTAANKLIYTPAGVPSHGKTKPREQTMIETNNEENGTLDYDIAQLFPKSECLT